MRYRTSCIGPNSFPMANRFPSAFLFLFMSSAIVSVSCISDIPEALRPQVAAVPAIFIFGDSTVDVGTNNFLPVSKEIKADFLYNGIDYPYSVPTGRFSNGYNTADQIVRLLGYKRSPLSFFSLLNHSSSFKDRILQGVNFASGGSGILDPTGRDRFNNNMSLGQQIQQFSTVRANITKIMSPEVTASLLSKSLFLISAGSNDIFEYMLNGGPTPKELMATLLLNYRSHLKSLYDLGARKFGIISIPPIGCCPAARIFNNTGGCSEDANKVAKEFYDATNALLEEMQLELQGMTYSLGNSYEMTMTVIENPYAFGIKDIEKACCGDAGNQCDKAAKLCPNRHEYLFWDRYHPTQRTSELAALSLYAGSTRFVTPFNFSRLVEVVV